MELHFKNRDEWRKWLESNGSGEKEIWIKFYKKHTRVPCIAYADAVEEALCFGWIDGKLRSINDEYYIQRFTPRISGSRWSKLNVSRMERMLKEGRATSAGIDAYKPVYSKPELVYENRSSGELIIPEDLKTALENDETALNNFNNFPPSARRLYVDWLNSCKKAETRPGRIAKIVDAARNNRKPGMM